ncbi:hypothetical protein D3C84_871400 [compost metagenome]
MRFGALASLLVSQQNGSERYGALASLFMSQQYGLGAIWCCCITFCVTAAFWRGELFTVDDFGASLYIRAWQVALYAE